MAKLIEITSLDLPELEVFTRLTEAQLRNRLEPEKGIFIAESPKVIARALEAGYQPLSLLMERKHLEGQGRDIMERCGEGYPNKNPAIWISFSDDMMEYVWQIADSLSSIRSV